MPKTNSEVNDELAVMKRFASTLQKMPSGARYRVVSWLGQAIQEMSRHDLQPGDVSIKQTGLFGAEKVS